MPALNSHIRQCSNWCSHAIKFLFRWVQLSMFQPLFVCYRHHLLTWCRCCQCCQHQLFSFSHFTILLPTTKMLVNNHITGTFTLQPQPCQTMPGRRRQCTRGTEGLSICVSTICMFFFFFLFVFLQFFFCLLNILDYHDKRSHQHRATS